MKDETITIGKLSVQPETPLRLRWSLNLRPSYFNEVLDAQPFFSLYLISYDIYAYTFKNTITDDLWYKNIIYGYTFENTITDDLYHINIKDETYHYEKLSGSTRYIIMS